MSEQKKAFDQNNIPAVAKESASVTFSVTFGDTSNTPVDLTKAQILTLTMTLFDLSTEAVINSRNAVNVKDANGGTVSTAGVLTMKLDPDDQAIVGSGLSTGDKETHVIRFDYTWNDGRSRTGRSEYTYDVEKLATPS